MKNNFKISENGKNLIKKFELCRLIAYWATKYELSLNKWTIGWGCTSYENGNPVIEGDEITQERADQLFDNKLREFEGYVNHYITSPINQNKFDALVSFCYNEGPGTFKTSTVCSAVNESKFGLAVNYFRKYIYQNGQILDNLILRREAEIKLFCQD